METKELAKFDYGQLDGNTAEFLRQKESNMREIVGKAYTDLGRELYEAQQELRRQGSKDGVFMAWYQTIGFNPKQVSRLIQRFELLTNCQEPTQKLLEDLPVSLTYEIAKPSVDSTPAKAQAKAEVLAGEIDTLKAYRERIAELERRAEQAEQRARIAEHDAELAKEALRDAEETVEVETEDDRPYGVKLGVEMYAALRELSDWQKKYSWIVTDTSEFARLAEADPNFRREFNRLNEFWRQMNDAISGRDSSMIIDASYETIN